MKIIILPDALLYLEELAHILYYNHYFGSRESAHEYLDGLIDEIANDLPSAPKRDSPPNLARHGMRYIVIRKNKQTYWYVFFDEYEVESEIVFQVRHITNNHVIAQYL